MAVRNFQSPDGTTWSVWEVIPGQISELRSRYGSHLPGNLADGWLCFDCGTEKRRLAPLPPDWQDRAEEDLWFWCRAAVPVRPRAVHELACAAPPVQEGDAAPAPAVEAAGV